MNSIDRLERTITHLTILEWAALGGAFLVAVALTVLVRRQLPRAVKYVFQGVQGRHADRDVGKAERWVTRLLVWLGTGLVLFAAFLVAAPILKVDTSGINEELLSWLESSLAWLIPRLVRLGVLLAITAAILRASRAIIPRPVRKYLTARAGRRRRDDGEAKKRIATLTNIVETAVKWVVVTLASFVALSELGFDIGPILAGAGVVGLAIGFGAQHVVRDWLAGFFVLMEDQYRIGDIIEICGVAGLVEEINMRRTQLRDLDGTVHTIPNGEVKTASNYSKIFSRVHFDLHVAYKEDLDRCIETLNRIGREMYDEGVLEGALREPITVFRVNAFGDSGVALKIWGATEPGMQWLARGEYMRRVKRAFDEEGIEIPLPHRTLYWGRGEQAPIRTAAAD